jgi:hypothetical protein
MTHAVLLRNFICVKRYGDLLILRNAKEIIFYND